MYHLNTVAGKKKKGVLISKFLFEQPGNAGGHPGKDGFVLYGPHVLLEFRADITLILFRLLQLSV